MSWKKIAAIAAVVIGVVMLLCSGYISTRVKEGKIRIEQGQKKVDTLDSSFSMSKYSKPLGNKAVEFNKGKLDAGRRDVAKYQATSKQLWIGGLILIIVGGVAFYYYRKD